MKALARGVAHSYNKLCAIDYSTVHPHLPFAASASEKQKAKRAKAEAAAEVEEVGRMTMGMMTNKSARLPQEGRGRAAE